MALKRHVKELVREANKMVGIVWSISKKEFGTNLKKICCLKV